MIGWQSVDPFVRMFQPQRPRRLVSIHLHEMLDPLRFKLDREWICVLGYESEDCSSNGKGFPPRYRMFVDVRNIWGDPIGTVGFVTRYSV